MSMSCQAVRVIINNKRRWEIVCKFDISSVKFSLFFLRLCYRAYDKFGLSPFPKCMEPVGIFYTVWYVNQQQVAKKEMATTVTIYRLCVDGDMENEDEEM